MDNTTTNVQGREIKFRAFDKVTKQMSPEFVLFGEFLLLGAIHAWQFDSGNRSESSLEALGDLVIMQFTGLRDKSGKEIYEGDILQDSIGLCEVVFGQYPTLRDDWGIEELSPKFCCLWSDKSGYTSLTGTKGASVIGNIYEHPHLLKPEGLVVSEGLVDNQ